MSISLTKNFEPATIEESWYRHWMEKGYFKSLPDNRPPFTVVIPPPNVTGVLHMGHTLNETIQDVLVRKARMTGFNACWVPGSDHASIATEARVVQMLNKEQNVSKYDIGRDAFIEHAYAWKDKYGGIIYGQIKKLGCSVDWDRTSFTMDDHYYKAVIKVFVDLFKKGLVYRGARMINWDPEARTALSDEEVEYRDVQGKLYYIKYRVESPGEKKVSVNSSPGDHIIIATQRPETIMGDTAVCCHPEDERYQWLKGKKVIVPLVNREVPVIFDSYVDPAFGTGILKITPAHDINDYNLGLKYNLPAISVINENGTISSEAVVFTGLDRFEARKKIIVQLKNDGLLVKEEDYHTRLGFSQRTNAVVEPRISTQWFVNMQPLARKALDAVLYGDIHIHPEDRFLATYKYWLENIREWCISRQLWWGQRIPAWYDEQGNTFVAETEAEAREEAQKKFPQSKVTLKQDEDVLDTWFSSWLWPIEVFRGITNPGNNEIKYYYPTSVLVTGQDIIFFWVARMIMAGMEYMDQKPFEHVYFTGMVRDRQGRKMSKSLGNSPDLLQLISQWGADAVRFGILISAPAGNDLLFDENSCEQGRNFNNKIWNALKLVQSWKERVGEKRKGPADNFAVQWFHNRLNEVRKEVEAMYGQFRISEALKTIYSLIWDDFCSWYLEWVKPGFNEPVDPLLYSETVRFFSDLVQLLHPFMPFITEEIYHRLEEREAGDDLCIKQFQPVANNDSKVLDKGALLKQIISSLRDARTKNNIKPKEQLRLYIHEEEGKFSDMEGIIKSQVKPSGIQYVQNTVANSVTVVVGSTRFYMEAAHEIDPGSQKEKLQKELEYQTGFLRSVEKKLANDRFIQHANPDVIKAEKKKKEDAEKKIRTLQESLDGL